MEIVNPSTADIPENTSLLRTEKEQEVLDSLPGDSSEGDLAFLRNQGYSDSEALRYVQMYLNSLVGFRVLLDYLRDYPEICSSMRMIEHTLHSANLQYGQSARQKNYRLTKKKLLLLIGEHIPELHSNGLNVREVIKKSLLDLWARCSGLEYLPDDKIIQYSKIIESVTTPQEGFMVISEIMKELDSQGFDSFPLEILRRDLLIYAEGGDRSRLSDVSLSYYSDFQFAIASMLRNIAKF